MSYVLIEHDAQDARKGPPTKRLNAGTVEEARAVAKERIGKLRSEGWLCRQECPVPNCPCVNEEKGVWQCSKDGVEVLVYVSSAEAISYLGNLWETAEPIGDGRTARSTSRCRRRR